MTPGGARHWQFPNILLVTSVRSIAAGGLDILVETGWNEITCCNVTNGG